MTTFGYFLSSEEHDPGALVDFAQRGEAAGFSSVLLSDHFHPWTERQGQSPFVWGVIGAIASTTSLQVTTGVTCPTVRIHPAVIAQAAATSSMLLDGRFRLGVGSGEALNEHITGQRWPPAATRLEMLEEAISVIRELWRGDIVTHHGRYFTVENAKLFSRPEEPPPILVSGFGPKSTTLAAAIGDGYVNVAPEPDAVRRYRQAGGAGPAIAAVKVCFDRDDSAARKLAHDVWRSTGIPGELNQELPMPAHFEQAGALVTEDVVTNKIPCGPDPERHVAALRAYADAGYDEVYVSQVGPDQEGFLRFFFDDVLPRLEA
jgi:G6PDH family F420-dependent oxidoreductase